jgi:uncharacterized protein YbjT (DUF2867 family)
MDVAVIGGHGKIALELLALLAADGARARGVIRNPDHGPDVEARGGEPVLCDIEAEDASALADAIAGADAVVFAAGAGPGSGPERKRTVDYGGAVKLIEACEEAGVLRYLMISAMGVNFPEQRPEATRPYYDAKADADAELRSSGLSYTIVRPGRLTDEPGTGLISAGEHLERGDGIPRADVAATLRACLDAPNTAGKEFDLLSGETPIAEAVAAL